MGAVPTTVESRSDESLASTAPDGAVDLALGLAMVSLSIFFGGALLAYIAARTGILGHLVPSASAPPHIPMPVAFWFSTFFILASGVALHGALVFSRNGRSVGAGRLLATAAGLGWIFLAIQIPGLRALLVSHRELAPHHVLVYALILLLVGIHAVHVLGGLGPMTALAAGAGRRPFDGSRAPTLKRVAIYWHVLAALWVVMFNAILLVG